MISVEEAIRRSKEIADLGLEIQSLQNDYATYARKMDEAMKKIEEIESRQRDLASEMITQCSKKLTIDDLDE